MKKLMLISSTGGHLKEMMQLEDYFTKYDYSIVTEKMPITESLSQEHNHRVFYLIYGARNNFLSYLFKFTFNILKSLWLLVKINPQVIITTGAHTAVPMCFWGWLFRKKIIFIESAARIHSPSLSGKVLHKMSGLTIVQWDSMTDIYKGSIYGGRII